MILPVWLFEEPFVSTPREIYEHKPLKQIARETTKTDDKKLNKELAKNMTKPFFYR